MGAGAAEAWVTGTGNSVRTSRPESWSGPALPPARRGWPGGGAIDEEPAKEVRKNALI